MIEISAVTKRFGSFTALDQVSCTMEPGRIHGLVGYNGAGKTTILKLAAGIYRPDEGQIRIEGIPVYENELLKRQIFMVQDEPYFTPQGTLDSMALFFSGYYPSWSNELYRKLTAVFKLSRTAKINSFSKGMQRQAALILGLSIRPQYLLMDESFDGLDLSKRNMMKGLLHAYLDKHNATVLISSHNLRELEGLCHCVAILKDKQIAYSADVEAMHRERFRYRAVCLSEGGMELVRQIGALKVDGNDRSFSFSWNGDEAQLKQALKPSGLVLLQTEPLALEDIYLEEMEAEEYDFSSIF